MGHELNEKTKNIMKNKQPRPSEGENPKGFHARYHIQKIKRNKNPKLTGKIYRLEPVDKGSEYFVMRLDDGGSDKKHIEACRKAVLYYADLIKDHIPELSKDLIERYS